MASGERAAAAHATPRSPARGDGVIINGERDETCPESFKIMAAVIIVRQHLVGASSGYRAAQSNTIPKAVMPTATAAKGNMISMAAVADF